MKKLYWVSMAIALFLWSSSSLAAPLSVPPYPDNVSVSMYGLLDNGFITAHECEQGDTLFGCTAFCDNYDSNTCERSVPAVGYPYEQTAKIPYRLIFRQFHSGNKCFLETILSVLIVRKQPIRDFPHRRPVFFNNRLPILHLFKNS